MTNEEAIDLYPGDIIKAPPPVSGMVRFRVLADLDGSFDGGDGGGGNWV